LIYILCGIFFPFWFVVPRQIWRSSHFFILKIRSFDLELYWENCGKRWRKSKASITGLLKHVRRGGGLIFVSHLLTRGKKWFHYRKVILTTESATSGNQKPMVIIGQKNQRNLTCKQNGFPCLPMYTYIEPFMYVKHCFM
jgi:hypothetical protein